MNPVYLSTGAFVGRVNNRNWHFPVQYVDKLECDGFEFMVFNDFVDILPEIIAEYRAAELTIPVVHAQKSLGDFVSTPTDEAFATAREMIARDCDAAAQLYPQGRPKVVAHCWGIPDSDTYFERITERIGILAEIAKSCGAELLPENSFCVHGSPLDHFGSLAAVYPYLHFIMDTRCAAFHAELTPPREGFIVEGAPEGIPTFASSSILAERVHHIHINDYAGAYHDWNSMYPIPQPTKGKIDWETFFAALRSIPYAHSITLEAPAMQPDRVDYETLNASIAFIRSHL